MVFVKTGNFHIGTFKKRENRFVVFVTYQSEELRCHLPNPGRMVELLFEEKTQLVFTKAPPGSKRKTDGTVVAIKYDDDSIINLDTMLFSELLPAEIENNTIELVRNWKIIDAEKTIGKHRFDYILDIDGNEVITEVKATTRVIDGVACFPDAVSARATSHLRSLQELHKKGKTCMIIFTVYKAADRFEPCRQIDPTFAETFDKIQHDIEIVALQITGTWKDSNHLEYRITGTVPIITDME